MRDAELIDLWLDTWDQLTELDDGLVLDTKTGNIYERLGNGISRIVGHRDIEDDDWYAKTMQRDDE